MKIYIMSLGQLVKSNIDKSITEFAKLKIRSSPLPFFLKYENIYKKLVTAQLIIDEYAPKILGGTNIIKKYKTGEMSDYKEFRKSLLSKIGIDDKSISDEEFRHAWNVMCEISDNNIPKIDKMICNINNDKILIFSATNPLQFEFIKNKIGKSLDKCIIVKSYEVQSISHKYLVEKGIFENELDREDVEIISLHNSIEHIDLIEAKFSYAPTINIYNALIRYQNPDIGDVKSTPNDYYQKKVLDKNNCIKSTTLEI